MLRTSTRILSTGTGDFLRFLLFSPNLPQGESPIPEILVQGSAHDIRNFYRVNTTHDGRGFKGLSLPQSSEASANHRGTAHTPRQVNTASGKA